MKRKLKDDLFLLTDAFYDNIMFDGSCEFGSIGVDCKRPFGNSSVERDILEIIGWEPNSDEEYSDEQLSYARELYCEKLVPYIKARWNEFKKQQKCFVDSTNVWR